jgi:transcriptional regulator with XRE-family HTH domain
VNNIKAIIKESGLKQKAICEKLGISEAMLSHYIHNRRIPPQDTIRDLSRILRTGVINLYPNAKKVVYWKLNS